MKTTQNIAMLTHAYLDLTRQMLTVEQAINADTANGFQAFAPMNPHINKAQAHELAIKSIQRTRAHPTLIKSGLLCASATTIIAIEALNAAKAQFKKTVGLIKGNVHKSSKTIQGLIKFDPMEVRDEALKRALRAIGGQSFDLRSCYAMIQILPTHTLSVSWTWAMRHQRIKKYTIEEAFQLTAHMVKPKAQRAAEIQLKQLPKNEVLIQKLDIPPQLKANIKYMTQGKEIKKCITVSGVLVVPQKTLPLYLWREQPEADNIRLSRPKKSEETLFVPTLKMYRYANHA